MDYLKLGVRNILRNGRRSVMTALAVAFGFCAINLFAGYIHNVYGGLERQAVYGERLGHITIMKRGALTEGKLEPEKYMFSASELQTMNKILRTDPAVEFVTVKLGVSGLVSNGKASAIFIGEGLVPEDAARLDRNLRQNTDARLDPDKTGSGIVGSDLANMLKLKAGEYVPLVVTTMSGQTNAMDMEVGATFNTGSAGTNDKFVLLPLEFTRRLLGTEGADRAVVVLRDGDRLEEVSSRIGTQLARAGFAVELHSWKDLSTFYTRVHDLFDMIFAFIFAIVLVVVLMSIVNTMTMSVVERTREIGTLRALGMKRRHVSMLFTVEGLLLIVFGGIAGAVLTVIAALAVNAAGFAYVPPGSSHSVPLLIDFVPLVMAVALFALATVAVLAALLPARRASGMKVVHALGHV